MRIAPSTRPWTDLLYRARRPVEIFLTASLRGVARRQPEAFDRLGPVRHATIRISPADLPVAFEMRPDGVAGSIRVVRPDSDAGAASARISGPLLTLLALFDGRGDADGAFFQRRIDIDGDTAAILALHNALEASELTMADILGLPRGFDPALQTALSVVGRWRHGEVRP
ncbi:MAG: SCP2 sterol-binding domain-containing protein [Brevundimonas sp.]|uniref:ubiquinone anaerobic biosynthesis accessory factor UbiT n=1 Tax=Brevundimonas sp. TaxID=1871086 RepID=UPI002721C314|nr:SCP2 sterol-binding domain-containing protein [Brevundimonas sp.]MDO9077054.1 SCP2 sterol-binding domain-containing protein [Brevundimonas sp.]MDP3079351.1 SCP2 sterol-binding domain-containing protein [Brevundimonas sp.]MDZ4060656.1 SCP2 sterol-binding domain-containing protein [Brevundimonas sp.]